MSWQILIAVSVLFFSLSTILQKVLLRNEKTDPIAFSIFFQFVTGLLIGLYGYIFVGMQLPETSAILLNLVVMVIFYSIGNIFLFNALKKIDASIFVVIFSCRILFTIVASSILIREGLNPSQFLGTLLILASIALVTLKSTRYSLTKYEVFAVIAALFFGLEVTNDRILLGHFELYSFVSLAFVAPAIFTIPVNLRSALTVRDMLKYPLALKMITLCGIYAIASIAYYQALQAGDNSSQIASIELFAVILTVLLSIVILKEREFISRKIIGAVLSIFGVLLLGR